MSSVIILYVKLKFLFLVAKEHNKLDIHGWLLYVLDYWDVFQEHFPEFGDDVTSRDHHVQLVIVIKHVKLV